MIWNFPHFRQKSVKVVVKNNNPVIVEQHFITICERLEIWPERFKSTCRELYTIFLSWERRNPKRKKPGKPRGNSWRAVQTCANAIVRLEHAAIWVLSRMYNIRVLAKIGFDTAEKEPRHVVIRVREPWFGIVWLPVLVISWLACVTICCFLPGHQGEFQILNTLPTFLPGASSFMLCPHFLRPCATFFFEHLSSLFPSCFRGFRTGRRASSWFAGLSVSISIFVLSF